MSRFLPGQEVVLIHISRTRNTRQRVKVNRVGRKYGYIVQYGQEQAFNLDNGYQARDNPMWRVATDEQIAEEDERKELLEALRAGGLEIRLGRDLDTERLRRVVEALR